MGEIPEIKLYGAEGCHKTHYYKLLLEARKLPFQFLDVEANEAHANELRSLYENGKLNFPTITIGKKKLRNPLKEELYKWINKLMPQILELVHEQERSRFTLDINGELAKIEYSMRDGTMYLNHSEVPYQLQGKGVGKVLVEKTFEYIEKHQIKAIAVCSYIRAVAIRSEKWHQIIG